ncbi:DUF3231 family protein [Bacillus sp. PS06]|uniref:DUF3231 family protein n=1 Tax=Bacillus sp. PS06 TaxID=2764176 RepID=UPI0017864313|nr:DUF3231 family protein [Bacillus sp. PS06]MBD8069361.1 DUF3231 family protein [Bacillus sp. PS06]
MENHHDHISLTSAELANMWTTYLADTMAICVFKHFLEHIEDDEVKKLVTFAMELSEKHVHFLREIYTSENVQIPQGFTEEDVNLEAGRLFSDTFYVNYIKQMAKGGLVTYGRVVQNMYRQDLLVFFNSCLSEAVELNKRATQLMLELGIALRPPNIPYPNQLEFVQKHSFVLEGLGRRQELTGSEVTNLFSNVQSNHLGSALARAFSQVAQSEKTRHFFIKGKEIALKHIKVFGTYLDLASLPVPMTYDNEVTKSQVAPFSDKLMMFHFSLMIYTGVGNYGISISESQRSDMVADYLRLIGEVLKYSEEGANIMIANQWLEQPPLSADRKELAKD